MTWGVIPVKCFWRGKSRLAPALGPAERAKLSRELFEHVVALSLRAFEHTLVVTDCRDVARLAEERGALTLLHPTTPRLSHSVDAGLRVVKAPRALVLMADLPDLRLDELRAMASLDHALVAAPDLRDDGTNALLVEAHTRTRFGQPASFEAHRALGASVFRAPGLARDIDTPEDLFSRERAA
jgi:2-phospho-L-lactate guanylyltransferase